MCQQLAAISSVQFHSKSDEHVAATLFLHETALKSWDHDSGVKCELLPRSLLLVEFVYGKVETAAYSVTYQQRQLQASRYEETRFALYKKKRDKI